MAKILIVEDEPSLSEAYELILKTEGHETKTAYDGGEALEILKGYNPDVILLDLRMPRVSGIEFLRQYNASQRQGAKIIVFSNIDTESEVDKAYELGADRYMLKSWASPKELLALIDDTLRPIANGR